MTLPCHQLSRYYGYIPKGCWLSIKWLLDAWCLMLGWSLMVDEMSGQEFWRLDRIRTVCCIIFGRKIMKTICCCCCCCFMVIVSLSHDSSVPNTQCYRYYVVGCGDTPVPFLHHPLFILWRCLLELQFCNIKEIDICINNARELLIVVGCVLIIYYFGMEGRPFRSLVLLFASLWMERKQKIWKEECDWIELWIGSNV